MVTIRDMGSSHPTVAQPPFCWLHCLLMLLLNSVVGDDTAVCQHRKFHANTDSGACPVSRHRRLGDLSWGLGICTFEMFSTQFGCNQSVDFG